MLLKAFNQISEVVVVCKYYLIIAKFTALSDVHHAQLHCQPLQTISNSWSFLLNEQVNILAKYIMLHTTSLELDFSFSRNYLSPALNASHKLVAVYQGRGLKLHLLKSAF